MSNLELIAIWAGILGLLLAIPLSVVGNILTPKVQSWWANTSAARRTQRIKTLREAIPAYEEAKTISARMEHIALGLQNAAVAFLFSVYILVVIYLADAFTLPAVSTVFSKPEVKEVVASKGTFQTIVKFFGILWPIVCGFLSICYITQSIWKFRLASLSYIDKRIAALTRQLDWLVDNSAPNSETSTKAASSQE